MIDIAFIAYVQVETHVSCIIIIENHTSKFHIAQSNFAAVAVAAAVPCGTRQGPVQVASRFRAA